MNTHMVSISAAFAAALALFPTVAIAQDDEPYMPWQEDWACGTPVPFDAKLAAVVLEGDPSGFAGDDRIPPFVVGTLPQIGGTYLFAKQDGAWKVYPLADTPSPDGVYTSPAGEVMILSWHKIEGPGWHTSAWSADGLRSFVCGELPGIVEHPEYWVLHDFNGTGLDSKVIAQLQSMEDAPDSKGWVVIATTDGGANWTASDKQDEEPAALTGTFTAIGSAPDGLKQELREAK